MANQDFLGFWTFDIRQEGHSQRSAPQKRHTAHLRRPTHCTPRKPSTWDREGDKLQPSTGGDDDMCQAPGRLSCWDLGQVQNAGPTNGVTENLNLSSLDLGRARKPGPTSDHSLQSNLESEQCRLGKYTRRELGANPVWLNHWEDTPVIFVQSVLPSPKHD